MAEIQLTITSEISQHLANMKRAEEAEGRLKQKRRDAAKAVKAAEKEVQNATKETVREKIKALNLAKQHAATIAGLGKQATQIKKRELTATKALTTEQRNLARAAKRVYDDTRSPMEQYRSRLQRLRRLTREAGMTQDTYRRAVGKLKAEYRGAGQAGKSAFGARALADLQGYAMGFVGVSGAVALVTQALREQQQAREEIAQKQREASFNMGSLAQLAKGDPAKMAQLEQTAMDIRRAGGARTMQEAGRVAFQLGSADALGEAGFVSRLATVAGEEGVGSMIGKAGKLQAALGKKETGTFKQIFSKATAAAAPVTDVGMADILQATAKAGGPAKAMGMSDEELFAAVSMVSQVYSPDEASTAVSRMLDKLAVKGYSEKFKGQPVANILESIRAQNLSPADLQKLLDVRGLRAYRLLEPGALRARQAEIEEGQRTGAIEKTIAIGEGSRLVKAARERERAEGQKEVAAVGLGIATNRVQGFITQMQGAALARGDETTAWGLGWAGSAAQMAYGPEALVSPGAAAELAGRKGLQTAQAAGGSAGVMATAAQALLDAAGAISAAARTRPVQQSNN